MRRVRRLLFLASLIAAVMIPAAAFAATGNWSDGTRDGTYEGTAWGYSSDITMAVTIADGKITDVKATSQDETPIYWESVYYLDEEDGTLDSDIVEAILENQGTESVDTVSGATYSSKALLACVDQALEKASGTYTEITKPQQAWFAGGTGTEADPFMIETAEQLYQVANSATYGIDYAGCHLKLANDINIGSMLWRPIGYSRTPFAGHFDGAGYTVSDLTINEFVDKTGGTYYASHSQMSQLGLFGLVGEGALIENVTVEGAYMDVRGDGSTPTCTGAVAGQIDAGAMVRSVSASGSIVSESEKADDISGGLIGCVNGGTLVGGTVDVDVQSCCAAKGCNSEAGGLTGYSQAGLIANCSAFGSVSSDANGENGNSFVSGLVGKQGGNLVNGCASGNVTAVGSTDAIGMIAGEISGQRTYNCWYKETAVVSNGSENIAAAAYGKLADAAEWTSNLNGYNVNEISETANDINATFSSFPVDITAYGAAYSDLKTWTADGQKLYPNGETATVKYVRPSNEPAPTPTIVKKANPLVVKSVNKQFKYKKVKKKAQTYKALTVTKWKGTISYKVTYANSKSKKALSFNKKTGKIKLKKKTKKGTYKVKIQVKAAGTSYYKSKTINKTIIVKVK